MAKSYILVKIAYVQKEKDDKVFLAGVDNIRRMGTGYASIDNVYPTVGNDDFILELRGKSVTDLDKTLEEVRKIDKVYGCNILYSNGLKMDDVTEKKMTGKDTI